MAASPAAEAPAAPARSPCACDAPRSARHKRLPPGYCARCKYCGAPGHSRGGPLPLKVMQANCDVCYDTLARDWAHWRGQPGSGWVNTFMQGWLEQHPPPPRPSLLQRLWRAITGQAR